LLGRFPILAIWIRVNWDRRIVDAEATSSIGPAQEPRGNGEGGREAGRTTAGEPGPADEREAIGASPAEDHFGVEGPATRTADSEGVEEGEDGSPADEGLFAAWEVVAEEPIDGLEAIWGGRGELGAFCGEGAAGHGRRMVARRGIESA
jgi:hypothetical protein